METPQRNVFGQKWVHSGCREGTIPSAHRHRRSISWEPWRQQQRVQIDYSKLRELCLRQKPVGDSSVGRAPAHNQFMAGYTSIFRRPLKRPRTTSHTVKHHSCPVPERPTHDIYSHMVTIHGRDPREQEELNQQDHLRGIHTIVSKLPIERSTSEVKQLAQHLRHFPNLLPDSSPPVLTGAASRALKEDIPKDGALPGKGGVYLILQGCVEKLTKDRVSGKITSTVLRAGESFGDLERDQHLPKSSYPLFVVSEPCSLMRITAFNYEKIVQKHVAASTSEKQKLIESCPLLTSVSPSVLSKLAEAVTWEMLPENTTMLQAGQQIERVAFIQQGRCLAYSTVPHTSRCAQVCIGELRPGNCVGETLLRGVSTQPYSVTTVTKVRVGWVSSTVLRMNEVDKHVLPESPMAVTMLTQEQLHLKYANKLIDKQWNKIRGDIVNEVLTERGISQGHSKWRHSFGHT